MFVLDVDSVLASEDMDDEAGVSGSAATGVVSSGTSTCISRSRTASSITGSHRLIMRDLRFAMLPSGCNVDVPAASSLLIFASTSAKTASIEMPSKRIDGMRIERASLPAGRVGESWMLKGCDERRCRGGETSSSASSPLADAGDSRRPSRSVNSRARFGEVGDVVALEKE